MHVIWMLNRAPIDSNHEITMEKRGKRIYVLTIESVRAQHAGNYTCLAENAAGATEHTSQLIVNGSIRVRPELLNDFFFHPQRYLQIMPIILLVLIKKEKKYPYCFQFLRKLIHFPLATSQ